MFLSAPARRGCNPQKGAARKPLRPITDQSTDECLHTRTPGSFDNPANNGARSVSRNCPPCFCTANGALIGTPPIKQGLCTPLGGPVPFWPDGDTREISSGYPLHAERGACCRRATQAPVILSLGSYR